MEIHRDTSQSLSNYQQQQHHKQVSTQCNITTMKTALISAICLFAATTVAAQTVIIDGVPRDTSFTLDATYKKERKYRPYIEPVRATLPQGVRAYEDVTYKKVSNSLG